MPKPLIFICSLMALAPSWAESDKKPGYGYIIENYFSKRKAYHSNHFALYGAGSFHRESLSKSLSPFSFFALGFSRQIKEIFNLADLDLQAGVFSAKLKRQKALFLELSPRIVVPEAKTAFPIYVGLGAGLGFAPRYALKKIPSLSASSQFFAGLRFFDLYHNLGFSAELNLKLHYPLSELEIYLEALGQFGLIFRF